MTITFDVPSHLGPQDVETVEAVNESLSRLRDQRVQKIVVEGRLLESKLAWKLAVYREVLLYRIVALTESIALNWNQTNFLGAYLPARALIETSALLLEFEHELKRHVDAADIGAIDSILNNRTFATRHKEWIEQHPETEAVNILTYLDRLDKRLGMGIRKHYDSMSERCHPNYLGHHQMFSSLDTSNGTTSFSQSKDISAHHDVVLGALLLTLLDEHCIDRLGLEIDRIAKIQRGKA
jgi:hypothetical protein